MTSEQTQQIRKYLNLMEDIGSGKSWYLVREDDAEGGYYFYVDSEETFNKIKRLNELATNEVKAWGDFEFDVNEDEIHPDQENFTYVTGQEVDKALEQAKQIWNNPDQVRKVYDDDPEMNVKFEVEEKVYKPLTGR